MIRSLRRPVWALAIGAWFLAAATFGPAPARANGAASTRNIIFGAAAVGGTLLILNHTFEVQALACMYMRINTSKCK